MVIGSHPGERKNVDEATIDANAPSFFIILLIFRTVVGMTMVVVVVDFNQRPTKRLSEAVANLDRLDLDPVHEDSEFGLLSATPWAMTETSRLIAAGRDRIVFSRRSDVKEFVADILGIGRHGWNGMSKTNSSERRIFFKMYRWRSSGHLGEYCTDSDESKS